VFAVREFSDVEVNLTWLILRRRSLLATPTRKKKRWEKSRTRETDNPSSPPPSATENTAGEFCATVPAGCIRLFFSRPVAVSFCSGFNFHSQRKNPATLSLSLSLIFSKLWPLVNIVQSSWIISVYIRQRWKLTSVVNVAAKLFNRHALFNEKLSHDDSNICIRRKR